jgi:hypothetical protein
MQRILPFCLFLIIVIQSVDVSAQDEKTPWWKNLFKKETVDEMDKNKPERDSTFTEISNPIEEVKPIADSVLVVAEKALISSDKPGIVRVYQDNRIAAIDSLYIQAPPSIMGYRIKVYFGDLNTARSERAKYISSTQGEACYLRPYPPNFAVLVGDYRTSIAAHRRMAEIKSMYPSAVVVPDEIQLPLLQK